MRSTGATSFPSRVPAAFAGAVAATAVVAQHVAGKATRDALFLSHYSVSRLPVAITCGSLVSGVLVAVVARAVARAGPARVARAILTLHGLVLVAEWALALRFERLAAVVVYLHTAAAGATIMSVFWSVVSESFDPHTARRAVGRIGAGATLGGVVGGGLAWVVSKTTSAPTALLVMAALCAIAVWGTGALARGGTAAEVGETAPARGFAALRGAPYLRLLALLVLGAAMLQSLLEYALGAQAVGAYGKGAQLLSFFAVFQTGIGVLSFLVQTTANKPALERLGIGGTIALLPASVAALGAAALAAPSLLMTALQRGAEGALRGSLFRSAYEVLFTPVPQALKRSTKTLIDVSFDRAGLLAGSGLTLGMLAVWPSSGVRAATAATIVLCGFGLVVAYLLHHGYVTTLAERLRAGTLRLEARDVIDATTFRTLSRTLSEGDRRSLLAQIEAYRAAGSAPDADGGDPVQRALHDLRSENVVAVRAALARDDVRTPLLAPQLIELLARDEVARDAMHVLSSLAPRVVGALVDALLDESRPARTRRRVARILGGTAGRRAREGLVAGLDVAVFDVRRACARALVELRRRDTAIAFDEGAMVSRARRELESDPQNEHDVEHTFDLLALSGPLDAIRLAYGALHCEDPFLRGVALEYLDVALPAEIRAALMPRLEATPRPPAPPRTGSRPIDDLLRSKEKIEVALDQLRRAGDPDAQDIS